MVAITASPVVALRVELIEESALNPRRHFRRLDELAASLKRQQFEPIVVRPHPTAAGRYELADGARRLRAAKTGGLDSLDARVCDLSDEAMLGFILGKGAQGNVDPLTPLEEAEGYHKAMSLLNLTLDGVATRFARSRTHVHRVLALLSLPKEAKAALEEGTLAESTAFEIARIPGAEKRTEAAKWILHSDVHGGVMPQRAASLFIQKHLCQSLHRAPFNTEDAALLPSAGACSKCPFRAGNDKDTYGDVKNPHTCMHPSCYAEKVNAARQRVLAREAKDGKLALSEEDNRRVFAPGEKGIHFKSDYVAWSQAPTRDMLKPEVTTAPRWSDLCDGEAKVQVYVGIDQQGIAVDVVKLSEALVAVPKKEAAIFSDTILRRYIIEKTKGPAKIASDDPRPKKASAKSPAAKSTETVPTDSWQSRACEWIASALECAPTLPPNCRDRGFALLREAGVSTQTQHAASANAEMTSEKPAELAEWVKAHECGMSPQKIAATYKVPLESVCGALEIDMSAAVAAYEQLRDDVQAAFAAAGLSSAATRDRITHTATGVARFVDLTTPEQMQSLLRMLSQRREKDPPKAGTGD